MASSFDDFLSKQSSDNGVLPALPLTHGTTAFKLREILKAGKISVAFTPCETLQEKLVFTFYGRPAYKVSPGNVPLRQGTNAACYLILNPELIAECYIMHALDTGAFSANFFDQEVDRNLTHKNFELNATVEKISNLINFYFGANESYYDCSSNLGLSIDQFDFEAYAYYALLNSKNTNAIIDERNSTLEICFDKDIPISEQSVLAILIPDTFAQHEVFSNWSEDAGIDVVTYRLTHHYSADQHVSRVSDAMRSYYIEKGYLSV